MAALLLLSPAEAQVAATGQRPAPPLSLLDVPYLSQSEALCGGAAAAMVLRYWGARGVAAEDFASLVDPARGGIESGALVRAVEERGYRALAASATPAMARRELTDGRPVIALIEDRPGAFHYVVIVGWHERAVVLHDPARTPYVLMSPREFERRWQASRNWMMSVTPGSESQAGVPSRSPGSESPVGVPGRKPGSQPRLEALARGSGSASSLDASGVGRCDALVADGVRLAQQNDLVGAERLLAGAAYQCAGAAPLRELAGVRLLQRRWEEVRDLAGRAVEIDPADAHAWRLLATARYIGGDHARALDAWNRAGEPRVDLVSVGGLQRTSHRSVERLLGIAAGALLTSSATERARRRLDELPAAALTRLEYVPRGSGTADVRAHVLERSVLPQGRVTWAAMGLRAAAAREIALPVSSLGHGGERLDVTWRFWPNRPGAGAALHVPGPFGVLSLDLFTERQPFDVPAIPDAERLTTHLRAADWATPYVRWEARAGFARWRGAGSFGTIGGSARVERGRGRAGGAIDAWLGEGRFATGLIQAGWRSSATRRGFVVDLSAMMETATAGAPFDLWPAGDTGHARRALVRAHPVLDEGRLRIERLGRHLVQSTAEAQQWWRAATVPLGAAVFLDAAGTSARAAVNADPAVTDVDVGAGFRLAMPGRHGVFRADLARGLRDGRTVFSLAWAAE